jgi:hypothetical protein
MENAFKNYQIEKPKTKSQRAELVKFFIDNLRDKNDKPFRTGFIVQKLSHIKTPDLYYVKSIFRDNLMRKGLDGASKEFWWSLKAK